MYAFGAGLFSAFSSAATGKWKPIIKLAPVAALVFRKSRRVGRRKEFAALIGSLLRRAFSYRARKRPLGSRVGFFGKCRTGKCARQALRLSPCRSDAHFLRAAPRWS